MRIILILSMFLLVACNMEVDVQINGEKNEELAQSWIEHLLISGDLDAAAEASAYAIFGNQGEVCSAGSRLIVQKDI